MQKIDGKAYNFILPVEMRIKLEKQAEHLGLTMSDVVRNNLDVGLEVYDIFYKLGLFTLFKAKKQNMKEFVREQLMSI